MTIRSTMTSLISHLRVLIADPAGVNQVWTNDQLQTFLDNDQRRANVDYFQLTPAGNFASGVTINHLIYTAPCGNWESDAKLYTQNNSLLTPSTSEPNQGRWTFLEDQPPPLYIVGKTYDLYGTAADVLEARVTALAGRFDFKTDGQEFKRSQEAEILLKNVPRYRERSLKWPGATMAGRGGDIVTGQLFNMDCDPYANPDRFTRWNVKC